MNTGPARAAFASRFYVGLPDDLPPADRDRRAEAARRLYFARLAYKSVRARGKKKAGPADNGPAMEARRDRGEPSAA